MADVEFEWSQSGYNELKRSAAVTGMMQGSAERIASAARSNGLDDAEAGLRSSSRWKRPYAVASSGRDYHNDLLKCVSRGAV